MQLHIVGKNIDLTTPLKTYLSDKFETVEKRFPHVTNVNVVLHIEKNIHIAETVMHSNGIELHAAAQSNDMYQSIDALLEKILTQLNKCKERIIEQHR